MVALNCGIGLLTPPVGAQSDTVSLRQIKQIPGMSGVMGVPDGEAAGEVWRAEEIKSYIDEVHAAGSRARHRVRQHPRGCQNGSPAATDTSRTIASPSATSRSSASRSSFTMPQWVHFGAHDDLLLPVTLKADGSVGKSVVGSLAEARYLLSADALAADPDGAAGYWSRVTALLYARHAHRAVCQRRRERISCGRGRVPHGRPPLEKAGVLFAERDTVSRAERMKVCACLNPLHTALAVSGCLLGYGRISKEMKDPELAALVRILGYTDDLMCVENIFEAGAVGAMRSHPHTQITYVLSGALRQKEHIDFGQSRYTLSSIRFSSASRR